MHVMQVIPKKADDVMNVGLLEGFTVSKNLNNRSFFFFEKVKLTKSCFHVAG